MSLPISVKATPSAIFTSFTPHIAVQGDIPVQTSAPPQTSGPDSLPSAREARNSVGGVIPPAICNNNNNFHDGGQPPIRSGRTPVSITAAHNRPEGSSGETLSHSVDTSKLLKLFSPTAHDNPQGVERFGRPQLGDGNESQQQQQPQPQHPPHPQHLQISPQYDSRCNYLQEIERLELSNEVMHHQITHLRSENKRLKTSYERQERRIRERLQRQHSSILEENERKRKKHHRRTAAEVPRHFKCSYLRCGKEYGSEGSLKLHIKRKHGGENKRNEKAGAQHGFHAFTFE